MKSIRLSGRRKNYRTSGVKMMMMIIMMEWSFYEWMGNQGMIVFHMWMLAALPNEPPSKRRQRRKNRNFISSTSTIYLDLIKHSASILKRFTRYMYGGVSYLRMHRLIIKHLHVEQPTNRLATSLLLACESNSFSITSPFMSTKWDSFLLLLLPLL